jgi:hypothetical protein
MGVRVFSSGAAEQIRNNDSRVLPHIRVIVTPGEVGWMTPEFHGWVTREDDRGLLVCEPSRIDVLPVG